MFYQVMVGNKRVPGNFSKDDALLITRTFTLNTWGDSHIYQHGKLYKTINILSVLEV